MSESRFEAFDAISAVMPAGIRLLAGFVRSIAPMVNCVILESDPVGVHEVSAIEFAQIIVSTKMGGSEMKESSHGTPKKACVAHAPSTLKIGMPTIESHGGNSMCLSTSCFPLPAPRLPPVIVFHAATNTCGRASRLTSEPTTIIVTPHHSDHWFTI